MVSDIIENTTSADDGQTWMCELSFYIPLRLPLGHQEFFRSMGSQMRSKRSVQFSTVLNYLVALQHFCYQLPDLSHFKIEALRASCIPVLQPNGCGKVNVTDTWVMVIYCIVIVITISHFFCFARLQMVLHDSTYAALGLSAILDQATERLGYDWEYCTGNLGQHTTIGC